MRHDPQDWSFGRFDKRKYRSLEEARRRAGRRIWATYAAVVVVPVVLVALVKGIL